MSGIFDALTPTTIANFARGAWDGISINCWALAEMKRAGAFLYDVGGDSLTGPIEAGRYQPTITAPGQDLSALFAPKVRHARWNFSWGEVANALVIDNGMLRRNSGDQALVRLRDTELPAMFRDTLIGTNGLVHQFYNQNGSTYAGQGLPFYGLPSFLVPTGTSNLNGFNRATKALTGSGPAATDREVALTTSGQTYGGLSLAPNGLGGIDGLQYDAWMPTMVNATSTAWNGSASASANIERSLQYLVNAMSRFGQNDPSIQPRFGVLDREYYNFLGDLKSSRETVFVTNTNKDNEVPDTGYKPTAGIMHAGILWRWDELMPSQTAYLGAPGKMKFHVQPLYKNMESSPLRVSGEEAGIMESAIDYDVVRRGYLASTTIPGQFVFEPRYWGCLRNYA